MYARVAAPNHSVTHRNMIILSVILVLTQRVRDSAEALLRAGLTVH